MNPLDPNDPRFTAKALGEEEIQPIDPDAEEAFESLKGFTRELKRELHRHAGAESLTDAQKAAVEQVFAERASQQKNRKILVFPFWRSAIAACLVVGLTGLVTWTVFKASLQQTVTWETGANKISISEAQARDEDGFAQESSARTESLSNLQPLPPAPPPPTVGDESAITLLQPGQQRQVSQVPEEVFELTPFTIESLEEDGFEASSALASPRLRIKLKDVPGSSAAVSMNELQEIQIALSVGDGRNLSASPQDFRGIPTDNAFAREAYDRITENEFKNPVDHPLSTFSIDVDTASYANVRRFLNGGRLPPPDAVRIEELINYFPYDYAGPDGEMPLFLLCIVDAAAAPWKPEPPSGAHRPAGQDGRNVRSPGRQSSVSHRRLRFDEFPR